MASPCTPSLVLDVAGGVWHRRSRRNDETVLRDIGRAVARIVIDEDHGVGRDRLGGVAQQIASISEPAIATAAE